MATSGLVEAKAWMIAAVMLFASAATAQTSPTGQLRLPPLTRGTPHLCASSPTVMPDGTQLCMPPLPQLSVSVQGFAVRGPGAGQIDWMRWPIPVSAVETWLNEGDPAIVAWQTMPSPRRPISIRLTMTVGPDGRGVDCEISRQSVIAQPVESAIASLCERVRHAARWQPALDSQGLAVASQYALGILIAERPASAGTTGPGLIHRAEPVTIPPDVAPGTTMLWPPDQVSGTRVQLLPSAGSLPLAPGGAAGFARDAPGWAGIFVIAAPDGVERCIVARSSSIQGFDEQACALVLADGALVYPWPTSGFTYRQRTAVHFVPVDGRPHAILPVAISNNGGELDAAGRAALLRAVRQASGPAASLAAIRLSFHLDETGRVVRCRVATSSGDDAADVAACRALQASTGFSPGRDIFGWVRPIDFEDWPLPDTP